MVKTSRNSQKKGIFSKRNTRQREAEFKKKAHFQKEMLGSVSRNFTKKIFKEKLDTVKKGFQKEILESEKW